MQGNGSPSLRILTNHWGQKKSPTWNSVSTYVQPKGTDLYSSIKVAMRLYSSRMGYDCVVLGAGRSDFLFALMQSLLPFRKAPCVMIDCLWDKDPNRFGHLVKKSIRKIANRSVDKFVVWANREIEAFSKIFSLPKEKFVFVPYHTTLVEYYNLNPEDGDYIFSGGNSDRDYKTLIEAVRDLNVKVCIGSTRPDLFSDISIPENVDIRGYSSEDYLKKMAGCKINVVAMTPGKLRSAGQQTFLNSMWLGKPTIVTDPEGAADYIENGEDGLLVPPGDPSALREAILTLINDPEKAAKMGQKAKQIADRFSTEEHFKKIVSIAEEVITAKKPANKSGPEQSNQPSH